MRYLLFALVFHLTLIGLVVDLSPAHSAELEPQSREIREPGYPRAAFHGPTLAVQSVVGALPLAIAGGLIMLVDGGDLTLGFAYFGAIALLSAPVVVPTAVSMTGNFLHYRSQYLGAYLGMAVGWASGILLALGLRELGAEPGIMSVGLPFGAGMVAGSVVGYHLQAHRRYRRVFDARLGPAMIPNRNGSHGVGISAQGAF